MSGLDEYRKYTPKNVKKNFISILLVAGVMIGFYSLQGAITKLLFNIQGTTYDQVEKGADTEYEKANLDKISIDLADYLDSLLNPDFLDSFLEDFLNQSGMTSEDLMDLYGDQLQDLFQGLNGEGLNSNMLDEFPPALAAALMAKIMFYVTPINSENPWTQPNETLFKITSYDKYDLSTFDWSLSQALDSESTLPYDTGSSNERKWMIKSVAQIQEDYKSAIPSVAPTPRIMDYSLSTAPISPNSELSLKQQAYVGGASVTGTFAADYANEVTNISYEVLYDASDYQSPTYYQLNSLDMNTYGGSDAVVQACLSGPISSDLEQTWLEYEANNPYYTGISNLLESTTEWQLATNTYSKINAILDFIGANFVLNPISTTRPADTEDPIEWFCQRQESNRPFEFTALAVALARSHGISTRYVSGYLWQDIIAENFGSEYYEDAYLMYPYRIANTYSWIETFIPTSPSGGDWIEFDNRYIVNETIPPVDDTTSCFNLKFEGSYIPPSLGYLRTETPNVEINITYNGNSLGNQLVNIYDNTYGGFIGTTTTNNFGIADYIMDFSQFVSGPHILNFTTQYGEVTYSNLTVVDVVSEVTVNFNPIYPNIINSSVNPTFALSCNGSVTDPNIAGTPAVKNAIIDFTLHQYMPVDMDRTTSLPIHTNISIQTGQFFLSTNIQNPSDGDYEIFSQFNGVFDLTNEINKYPQEIRDYLLPFAVWNAHAIQNYVVTDVKTDFSVYDYKNCTYSFSINNTLATEPCYGDRDAGLTFQFIATAKQSLFPAEATIQVLDLSNSNRLICTFTTPNGAGNINVSTSVGLSQNWTAGPHYLQATWINCPVSRVESRWVVVNALVQVYQTSQNYTNQGSGPGAKFFAGTAVDNFTISGCLYDPGTKQNLTSGYTIYYDLRNTYGVSTPYYIMNGPSGNLYQTIAPNQKYYSHQSFYFAAEDGSLTSSAPYYTESYFRMEWFMTTGSWQNSWNDYWRISDSGSYIRNTSISTPFGLIYGYMNVADPTDASFNGFNNNTSSPFQSSYTNNAPVVLDTQTFTVIGQFNFLGTPTVGAWVTFSDVYDRGMLGSNGTKNGTAWGDGYVSYSLTFGSTYAAGPHKIQMTLTFDIDNNAGTSNNLTRTIYTWIFYNVTNYSDLSINAYRSTWQNLTRGSSGSTLTIYGSLQNSYGKGMMYANIRCAVYDSEGNYASRSNYFDLSAGKNPIIVSKVGTFDITFYVKSGVNVGNFSVIFYFDGTFTIPTDTSPLYSLTSTGLAMNSSYVPIRVYDQPAITCNFVYSPSGGIVAGIVMNFTGRLTYSNGTGISNQNITLTIWDEDTSVLYLNSTIVTDANGYYAYNNIKVKSTWNVKSYQINCARNDNKYIYACTTGERLFTS